MKKNTISQKRKERPGGKKSNRSRAPTPGDDSANPSSGGYIARDFLGSDAARTGHDDSEISQADLYARAARVAFFFSFLLLSSMM